MCEPVTAITAVAGVASAVGGLNQAHQKKAAAAKDWNTKMQIRKINHDRAVSRWNLKKDRYKQQVDENFLSASIAYGRKQLWANDQASEASKKYEDSFTKIQEYTKGIEMTGKTSSRLQNMPIARLGRIQAMHVSNLTRARTDVQSFGRDTRRKLMAANNRAYDQVGFMPQPGIAPPKPDVSMDQAYMQAGISLLGTAASSASAFAASKPPTPGFSDSAPGLSKAGGLNSAPRLDYTYQPMDWNKFPSDFSF